MSFLAGDATYELRPFTQLAQMPPFDESDTPSAVVEALRRDVGTSRGVLIITPEYAYGVPGVLKNALDWLVGSGELDGKPVAMVTVSSTGDGGRRAGDHLADTLSALNACLVDRHAVANVRTKLTGGRLSDKATADRLRTAFATLEAAGGHQLTGSSRTP